ncbi:MAG: hypothetical protein ACLTZT_16415 [Butyricimonas faecalis]
MFPENVLYVGHWEILDIRLHPEILREYPATYYYLTEDGCLRLLIPGKFSHKGTLGNTLLIAVLFHDGGCRLVGQGSYSVRNGIAFHACSPQVERNDSSFRAGSLG